MLNPILNWLCWIPLAAVIVDGDQLRIGYAAVPAIDYWGYGNATSRGAGQSASTFSSLPAAGENRLSQFLLKFNTVAAGIPAGLGVGNYMLEKLTLTLVVESGDVYDPTEDSRLTYGVGAQPDFDPGRPIEIYGAGFRNGFTAANYLETSSYSSGGIRSAYAMGYDSAVVGRDVTNNVTAYFDPAPWGIGKVLVKPGAGQAYQEIAPGERYGYLAHVEFQLNLSSPGVANYLEQGLHQGYLWFVVSSLHSTSQQASDGYPRFFTKESLEQQYFNDVAASLNVEYSLPLRIAQFTHSAGDSCAISWNASPGFFYHIERSNNLQTGTWIKLNHTPLTTSVPTILSYNAAGLPSQSFFRIVRNE